MLMGRVPPSGLIKLPSWEGSQFQRHAQSHLQSINALSFAVGYDLKPWTSAIPIHQLQTAQQTCPQELHVTGTLYGVGCTAVVWEGGGEQWFLILYQDKTRWNFSGILLSINLWRKQWLRTCKFVAYVKKNNQNYFTQIKQSVIHSNTKYTVTWRLE